MKLISSSLFISHFLECDCGPGHTCDMLEGRKICICAEKYFDVGGRCESKNSTIYYRNLFFTLKSAQNELLEITDPKILFEFCCAGLFFSSAARNLATP